MSDEVKIRLYVTAIVIVMAILYVAPLIVNSHFVSVRSELVTSCYTKSSGIGWDFCWDQANRKAELPFWEYLLPYIPAGAILWLNWLIKPNLRLSDASYPRRTLNVFLWIGLLVAAVSIWVPIQTVLTQSDADLHKIALRDFVTLPWTAAAWLIAPLLFHHLIAPVAVAEGMRKGKITLWLLAATPIAAFLLMLLREGIRALRVS